MRRSQPCPWNKYLRAAIVSMIVRGRLTGVTSASDLLPEFHFTMACLPGSRLQYSCTVLYVSCVGTRECQLSGQKWDFLV